MWKAHAGLKKKGRQARIKKADVGRPKEEKRKKIKRRGGGRLGLGKEKKNIGPDPRKRKKEQGKRGSQPGAAKQV